MLFFTLPLTAVADSLCSQYYTSASSGSLTDSGGSSGNYSNYESCGIQIQSFTNESITLTISSYSVESGYDYIEVYDGYSASDTRIARITGSGSNKTYTATSGAMYVRLSSDYSVTKSGFSATWAFGSVSDSCTPSSETVADNFTSVTYNENNGSENWLGEWSEIGESDGAGTGILRINNQLCTSGNCLRLGVVSDAPAQTFSEYSVTRSVDLGSTQGATLSYDYYTAVSTGSLTVKALISDDNGSSWTTLKTYSISSSQFSKRQESLSISSHATSQTLIRFEVSGNSAVAGFYIDSLSIAYTTVCDTDSDSSSLSHLLISHDQQGAYCANESINIVAYDDADVLENYSGTITLDTQTGSGTWSLASGDGTLLDSTANDGLATYTYAEADKGSASFELLYVSGNASINIDAYQGSIRDDDTEGDLHFSATGFTITANALSNPPQTPINDPITTKVSGQSFTIAITAYGIDQNDGTCGIIETYDGDKSLTISTNYVDPTSGTLDAIGSGTVNFDQGQALISTRYDDVGQISVAVTATGNDAGASINGQSSVFIVKPASFSIAVANNPQTTTTGEGFTAAGEAFTVDVQALNALNTPTPNYGNELVPEGVVLSIDSLVFPDGGNVGSLSDASAFSKITASTFQNDQVSWSEVGSMRLQAGVSDGDYLGEGDIQGAVSDPIGRFYPARFLVDLNSVGDACTSWTYLSHPALSVTYQVSALNEAGEVTTNYDVGLGYSVGSIRHHAELGNNGSDIGSRLSIISSTWSAGEYGVSDTQAAFARASTLEAPLNSVQLALSVNDADEVAVHSPSLNPITDNDCASDDSCTAALIGSASFYFGRLSLASAYGPESAVLPANLLTEYWDGSQFVTNTLDSCTVIARSAMSIDSLTLDDTDALAVDLSGGVSNAQFAVLNSDDIGFVSGDARLQFSARGISITRKSFTVDVNLASLAWLRSDWDQDGDYNNDQQLPTAVMSFKTYRGHDRVLYWRHR